MFTRQFLLGAAVLVLPGVAVLTGVGTASAQRHKGKDFDLSKNSFNVELNVDEEIDRVERYLKLVTKDKHVYRDKSDTWLFFEGNHCTQTLCGSLPRSEGKKNRISQNVKQVDWFKNDEARSVLVRHGKKGDILYVFDDPGGKKDDDWARIELLRDVKHLQIGTFEQTYANKFYKITYHHKNGLAGKISHVRNF